MLANYYSTSTLENYPVGIIVIKFAKVTYIHPVTFTSCLIYPKVSSQNAQ